MNEALIARFADSLLLVSAAHQRLFEGHIKALGNFEDCQRLMAAAQDEDDDFWPDEGDWRTYHRPYVVKGGILQIPIQGVLLHDFPWFVRGLATGYEYIRRTFERGMADDDVRAIALLINSPGGEVAGNFDLVDKMYAARGKKPVRAFAHEYAYSAAYSIASVADHIAVSRTGGVGSIGVVMAHVDMSKALDQAGFKITFISAPEGGHKTDGNPFEPLKPEVRSRLQKRANELYDLFVATVARNRSMDEKAIRDTKALTFSAAEAVSIALADSIGPLDDALAAYAAELFGANGEVDMTTKEKDNAAAVQAARDEGYEVGYAEGYKAGYAKGEDAGIAEGAKAERERINAIISSEEGKAHPKAALSAALKTDMTVDQARAFLADLPEEKVQVAAQVPVQASADNKQKFDAAMNQDRPDVGSDVEASKDDDPIALARAFGLQGF